MKKLIYMPLFLGALAAGVAYAGQGSDGTDIIDQRKIELRYLFSKVNMTLSSFLEVINLENFEDIEARNKLQKKISEGLIEKIQKAPALNIQESCFDSGGVEKSATSIIGDRNGLICYNLSKGARDNISPSQVLAIAIHEHIQQMDLSDEDEINDRIGVEIKRLHEMSKTTQPVTYSP